VRAASLHVTPYAIVTREYIKARSLKSSPREYNERGCVPNDTALSESRKTEPRADHVIHVRGTNTDRLITSLPPLDLSVPAQKAGQAKGNRKEQEQKTNTNNFQHAENSVVPGNPPPALPDPCLRSACIGVPTKSVHKPLRRSPENTTTEKRVTGPETSIKMSVCQKRSVQFPYSKTMTFVGS
jgi:hypothetical protein